MVEAIELNHRVLGICLSKRSKTIGNDNGWLSGALRLFRRRVGISQTSLKSFPPETPWQKVAGIGNVLRHNYENIAAPFIWKLVQADLPEIGEICRAELAVE